MAAPTNPTLEADVAVLREVPFFAGLPEEHLKLIAFSAETRSLPDKLLLYDEGQLLHSAYVILSGTLKAEHKVKGADKIVKRDIGPGVILGERALILDTRAMESVRVETRTRVLQLRKLMFRRLLQEHPEMAKILCTRLTRQVIQMSAEMQQIGQRLKTLDAELQQ